MSHLSSESSGSCSSSDTSDEETIQLLQQMSKMDMNENKPNQFLGTGFVYDPVMTQHQCEWDASYPENPRRITESLARCKELGLIDRCVPIKMQYLMEDQLTSVHSADHVTRAKDTCTMSKEELMELAGGYDSWYSNNSTYEAALAAAGSTLCLVDHILEQRIDNGFAMVRPPGHHAMHNEFNGYCTFNNVAIAAERALARGLNRVLIVDWDVHHGQGVQRHFYSDPRVLYVSIHRYEHGRFWPELRESDYDHIGQGPGQGYNVNVPLNKTGMTDSDYMAVLHQVLMPIAYEFNPQLVLVASGYDAALGCPEGEMMLTPPMYAHMTHQLMSLANGRVAVVLEGGYCIKSLAEGCALTLRSLLGDPCPVMDALSAPSDSITTTILNVIKVLRPHWECFDVHQTLLPGEECVYGQVNMMPPVKGVEFSTRANRPEKFKLEHDYPVQSPKIIKQNLDHIDRIIAKTDLLPAANRCCYVFDPDMRAHRDLNMRKGQIQEVSHPERPDRISRIYELLNNMGMLNRCLQVESRLARKEELLMIHTEDHIDRITQTQDIEESEAAHLATKYSYVSVFLHPKSLHCALLSCGSLLNVVEAVMTQQAQSGVAIIRPPGHHAEAHCAMGFCIFNNVGVAAKFAQKHFGLKRILILDWDVHHGNATQNQFYDDPSVLYISLHRYDNRSFFPGKEEAGAKNTGKGMGIGYNVNIPWNYDKMGDAEYLSAFTNIVMPIAYQYAPELVLISAGFDAALGDPLGGYRVTPVGYAHMTHMLMSLAGGRVVLALEGGYNLESMSVSMAACTSVLLGDVCPGMTGSTAPCPRACDTINKVVGIQKKFWPALKVHEKIPDLSPEEDTSMGAKKRVQSARPSEDSPRKPIQRPVTSRLGLPPRQAPVRAAYSDSLLETNTSLSINKPGDDTDSHVDTPSNYTMSVDTPPAPHFQTRLPANLPMNIQPRWVTATLSRAEDRPSEGGVIKEGVVMGAVVADNSEEDISSISQSLGDVQISAPGATRELQSEAKTSDLFKSSLYREPDPAPLMVPQDVNASAKVFHHKSKRSKKDRKNKKKQKKWVSSMASRDIPPEEPKGPTEEPKGPTKEPKGPTEEPKGPTEQPNDAPAPPRNASISRQDEVAIALASGGAGGASAGGSTGATGGSARPNTVDEFLQMKGVAQMYAVTPLTWCPHLEEARPLPPGGLDAHAPCATCTNEAENWVCLTCYKVECSRFVNEHMLMHRLETDHNLVMSYSDISVWCYACDNYVDNKVIFPHKNAAHISKFGEALPGHA